MQDVRMDIHSDLAFLGCCVGLANAAAQERGGSTWLQVEIGGNLEDGATLLN